MILERADIDLVVCTKDRPTDLARLLATIARQRDVRFRCIVIDQSVDRTANREAIASLEDPRFVYVEHDDVGKSKALNVGVRTSTAPLIVFTDDDCELQPDWLASAQSLLVGRGADLIFGAVEAIDHDQSRSFVPDLVLDREEVVAPGTLKLPAMLGMGANMAVRRVVFEQCGGFDESMGPGAVHRTGEDCELAYRALRGGFAVHRVPSWSLVHWGVRSLDGNAARVLVVDSFRGIGIGYGKHLRRGDWRAIPTTLHQATIGLIEIADRLRRGIRPLHVRRVWGFAVGVLVGFRSGASVPPIPPPED